jgi:two-component system chemotaxis response regulator CheB
MLLDRGRVRLEAGPRENHQRPSIDVLFRSASQAYGSEVVGVVLTGNLDDGSAGLAEIKTRRGIAIVQNPEEAMAASMPVNAIENTDVDFILPAGAIGPKLVELSSQVIEPVVSISRQGDSSRQDNVPSGHTYACPECGGVLEEIEENKMQRFRCRVGHLYSLESLLADQTEAVERALWAAIRSMDEQAEFSDRLAENSRQKEHTHLVRRFSEKAVTSRENASVLRDLLQKTADEIFEVPDERTGTE